MPQDNLTQIFKAELARKGIIATDLEIDNFLKNKNDLPTAGAAQSAFRDQEPESMWKTAGATDVSGDSEDWWSEALGDVGRESDFNLLSFAGKGIWAALETGTFGTLGLAARWATPELYEKTKPKNFAERVSTGIGGVAGFIPPFSMARSVVGTLLKGAKPVAGALKIKGATVGYGATKASEQFTKNSIRILTNDRHFVEWATKQGISRKELPEWIVKNGLLDAPKSKITMLAEKGGKQIMNNHTLRAQYKQGVDENIGKIIRARVQDEAGLRPGFTVSDRAIGLIEDEVKKYIGGKYNFPITKLNQYLAAKWGNSKMASIGAAAAEEAILFTAVEIPLNFVNSIYNSDPQMDFNLFGTIGHAMVLGGALGGIRLIPGGKDMGILSGALSRMSKMMNKKRRWDSYSVTNPADRITLTTHAKNIWEHRNEMAENLRIKNLPEGHNALITKAEDISWFAANAERATELKKWLVSIETAFNKEWWPKFVADAGRDIWGSSFRMLAGSAAFNLPLWKEYVLGNVPTEDFVFHTALGAVLSKRGHTLEYKDYNGEWQTINNNRPYIYTDKFEKVNEYLNLLGVSPDNASFSNLLNNLEIMKKYGAPDYSHTDLSLLLKIAQKNKLIANVEDDVKLKSPKLTSDDLYDTIRMVLEGAPEVEGKRFKSVGELSTPELRSFFKDLEKAEFKTLKNFRTTKAGQGNETGILNWADVLNIVAQSNGVKTEEAISIHRTALRDAWNEMYKIEDPKGDTVREDKNGNLILRPVIFDPDVTKGAEHPRVVNFFGSGRLEASDGVSKNTNSALGLLRDRVKIEGPAIRMTREMTSRLFGDGKTDKGLLGKNDAELNRFFFGEDGVSEDMSLYVGHSFIRDALNRNLFIKSIVNTRNTFAAIRDFDEKLSGFDRDTESVHHLMSEMFGDEFGFLADVIQVESAGKQLLSPDSRQQKFAKNVLTVLRSDMTRNTQRKDLIESDKVVKVSEKKVNDLMKLFDKVGVLDGFVGTEADVKAFVDPLVNYTRRIELANAKRNDGTPLTGEDLSTIAVLAESRLLGENLSLADLEAVVGDVKATLLKTDVINKNSSMEAVRKHIGTMKPADLKKLVEANKNLWKLLEATAKRIQGNKDVDRSVQQLLSRFLEIYNGDIDHLIVRKGVGALKYGADIAAVTPDYLERIVKSIDNIKKGHLEISHNRLLDEIDSIYQESQYKPFLKEVLNSFIGKRSNVPRVMEALGEFKLFNPKTGKFLLPADAGDQPLRDRIKEASNRIRILTNPITTDRDIDMLMERDRQDFSPNFNSDLSSSMSLEKLRSKWGLTFSAPTVPGQTLADVVQSVLAGSRKGDFTLDEFEKYVTKDMIYEKDGNHYSKVEDMESEVQSAFAADLIKVWNGFHEGVKTRLLKAGSGSNPISENTHARSSALTDYLTELFGETVFAHEEFRLADGTSVNIKGADSGVLEEYFGTFKNVGATIEALTSRTEAPTDPLTQETGYIISYLGDMDSGIGIPLVTAKSGKIGQDTLANDFVVRLKGAKERFKDEKINGKSISDMIDSLMTLYVTDEKTRIVDQSAESEKGELLYTFRTPRADTRASEDATVMLTVAFGDRVMGKNFWEALINSKGEKWTSQKELAHSVLRRFRLFANRNTTRMSKKRAKGVVNFYKKYNLEMPSALETLAKTGKYKFHVLRDESQVLGDKNPSVSSVIEDVRRQIDKESKEAGDKYNIVGINPDDTFRGGLGDASKFNSVVIVSKDFIDALKIMSGENNDLQYNIVAGKPVITFANDGKSAFLGKTMFMVDPRFDSYLKENNINAVVFSSAVKLMGEDYNKSVIDMKQFDDMDQVLKYRDKTGINSIELPIESIEMQSWVATDHAARIPMHVGTDLVGSKLNKSYFNWLMDKPIRDYEQNLSRIVSGGDINNMIASAKNLLGKMGDDIDNDTYSSMHRWLDANGYPFFLPFKNSINNAMFRHYIEEAGTFSPMNNSGSQSVLTPDNYAWDHKVSGLRNTIFHEVDGERDPQIFTYGQIEIGSNNRSKIIERDSASVTIHHSNKPDEILSWNDLIKRTEAKDIFDKGGSKELYEVHDYLREVINKKLGKGENAEILLTVTRTPSTRESDKVLVGLKGFVEGNYGRLNSYDALTRLEADYDIDKVNYWWNTPSDILNAWNKGSGKILSIKGDDPATSVKNLSILNKKSLVKYNYDDYRAGKYRGIAMKSRRVVQWLKHYQGFSGKTKNVQGYNLGWSTKGGIQHRILIDHEFADRVDEQITKDIQGIVDSKDGYPEDKYTAEWFKNTVIAADGMFKYERKEPRGSWENAGELEPLHRDIIDISLQPYKNLLQLSTDQYVEGQAKRVDYQSFITGYDAYNDAMRSLNRYVIKGLKRRDYNIGHYGEIFFEGREGKKSRDIFGLHEAKMPSPLKKGVAGDYSKGDVLLPFDRGIWSVASLDRLSLSEPIRSYTKTEGEFDKLWEIYIDKDNMEDGIIEQIRGAAARDVQKIEYLNVVDRRLRRARGGLKGAKRYRDKSLEEFLSDRVNKLESIRNRLNEEILSDFGTRKEVAKNIRQQIVRDLHRGKDVYLATVGKTGKILYTKGGKVMSQRRVNLLTELGSRKFRSEMARRKWISDNMNRINASIWTKGKDKLALNVKGMSSNEYAQLVMWHRTLASKASFVLDPRQFSYSNEFEYSISDFKRRVGEHWYNFRTNREFSPNEREDVVSSRIMRELEEIYTSWEDRHEGLGKLFIIKMMAPKPSTRSVTYDRGHWLSGFDNVSKQVKFIGLGLRFLSSTESISEMPEIHQRILKQGLGKQADSFLDTKQAIYKDLAETFTDGMRVLYNQEPLLKENIDLFNRQIDDLDTGRKDYIREQFDELNINDAINHASEIFATIDRGDIDEISQISADVRDLYGVTGDVALDYLSLKGAPLGWDQLLDVRRMADFYFKPRKVLNSKEKMRNASNLKSYYGFVRNNAKIYFGKTSDGNMIQRDIPHVDVRTQTGSGFYDRHIKSSEEKVEQFKDNHTTNTC